LTSANACLLALGFEGQIVQANPKVDEHSLTNNTPSVGVVVIGRNEGERLKRCIASVKSSNSLIVYVDSGSDDGSADWARRNAVNVVDLDLNKPFTAARARNAGFERLLEFAPAVPIVQFVDGDCELLVGWLDSGQRFLNEHVGVAAVCGRLRERHPDRSVYNLLCDLEWQAETGDSRSVGGNAMLRSAALQAAGGYREDLLAGEEPELCVRLRQVGWRIWRLPDEMALHDAAMTRFGQWWTRAVRSGYALAEGAALHGRLPERYNVRELRRGLLWGLGFPVAIGGISLLHPAGALLALGYPLQIVRLAVRDGVRSRSAWWQALFSVLARFAEVRGAIKFWLDRRLHRPATLFEYK
jgi:glycosyltransferase involved in cell wall biosynthesis